MKFLIGIFLLLSNLSHAEEKLEVRSRNVKTQTRHSIGGDFNIWSENVQLNSAGTASGRAQYYGNGINYEYNSYEPDWGWGALLSYAQGYGIVGSSATTGYFEKRIPWTAFRLGGRIFNRLSDQVDLGLQLFLLQRSMTWPTVGAYDPITPASSLPGYFVDLRYKFSESFDMAQSFGLYGKETSMAWKIGIDYYF